MDTISNDVALAPEGEQQTSSPDDDSSMEDDETSLAAAVDHARTARDAHPYDYGCHLAFIQALRSQGEDIEELRKARNNFATYFPLALPTWKEWIEDEMQMAASSEDRSKILLELFPRSLSDYLSIDLHEMQLRLAIDMWRESEISHTVVRNLFQKSQWYGATSHFSQGRRLWDMFLSFTEECQEMEETRGEVYHQYTSSPFHETENPSESLGTTVMECKGFELKLANAGSDPSKEDGNRNEDTIMSYRSYAEYAKGVSKSFAVSIYERYVSECYLCPEAWMEYIHYCQSHEDRSRAFFVSNRAARNIPWKLEVWAECFISLCDASNWMLDGKYEDMFATLVNRASSHIMGSDDLCGAEIVTKTAWTTFLSLEATKIVTEAARKTLYFNVRGSTQWAFACCHAALVMKLLGDSAGAEECLESVVNMRGTEPRWWLKYCSLIAETSRVRHLFERGVLTVSSTMDIDILLDAWIEYECRVGSDKASIRRGVSHAVAFVRNRRVKLPEVVRTTSGIARGGKAVNKTEAKKKKSRSSEKRKRARVTPTSTSGGKDVAEGALETVGATGAEEGKVRSVDAAENDSEVQANLQALDVTLKTKAVCEGKADSKAKDSDLKKGEKGITECEPNTIFINNLAFKVSEVDLRKTFEFAGMIKGIRLPKRSDGASKGIAYIEFEKDGCVEKALTVHNRPLNGRAVWVRRSKPPARKLRKVRGGGTNANVPTRKHSSLMPARSSQRKATINAQMFTGGDSDTEMGEADEVNGAAESVEAAPKSQEDFRAYFLQNNKR